MTSSADLVLNLGCGSTGMPRPLSRTRILLPRQHLEMDRVGVARDRLVHGVVEDLGHEMVHGALVGAADVHAGALADGLEPFQHLDVACGV